jgi:hypothetical protein
MKEHVNNIRPCWESSSRGSEANGRRGATTKGRSRASAKIDKISSQTKRRGLVPEGIETKLLLPNGWFALYSPDPFLVLIPSMMAQFSGESDTCV